MVLTGGGCNLAIKKFEKKNKQKNKNKKLERDRERERERKERGWLSVLGAGVLLADHFKVVVFGGGSSSGSCPGRAIQGLSARLPASVGSVATVGPVVTVDGGLACALTTACGRQVARHRSLDDQLRARGQEKLGGMKTTAGEHVGVDERDTPPSYRADRGSETRVDLRLIREVHKRVVGDRHASGMRGFALADHHILRGRARHG